MAISIRKSLLLLLLTFALSAGEKSKTEVQFGIGSKFGIEDRYDVNDDFEYENSELEDDPFTDEWLLYYNDQHLSVQPTWYYEGRGNDSDYVIRDYPAAWWASSYTPCLNQTVATGYGYLKLYLYFHKYNYQEYGYPLTYPILTKIEKAFGEEEKDAERCPDKFSQNFYIPIGTDEYPAATPDDSISVEIVPRRRYYVKRYAREDTEEFQTTICNAHAGLLAASLALDGVKFNPYTWYCAQYESGKSGLNGIFEVWYEGSVTE